MPGGHEAARRF